jgi:prevent-host-death family protein
MAKVMKAAEFKARCLEVMNRVAVTGETVIVTKRGRPMVRLSPATNPPKRLFGFFRGKIKTKGDVIAPLDVEWDANRT